VRMYVNVWVLGLPDAAVSCVHQLLPMACSAADGASSSSLCPPPSPACKLHTHAHTHIHTQKDTHTYIHAHARTHAHTWSDVEQQRAIDMSRPGIVIGGGYNIAPARRGGRGGGQGGGGMLRSASEGQMVQAALQVCVVWCR